MNWFKRGVTLVEVLVVVAIVAILVGLTSVAVGPAMSKVKTEPICAQNLKQIATALNLYVADSDGAFPDRQLLGDRGALSAYHLQVKCPLGTSRYRDDYRRSIDSPKAAAYEGLKLNTIDPAGRPIPDFDPTKDVLSRCLNHGYEGFNALKGGGAWNRSDPESKGKVLGVRFDTSVTKVPPISCWEFKYLPKVVISGITSWRSCDRP